MSDTTTGKGAAFHAANAVEAIIIDLSDRRGLGQEWAQIDDDIRDEIKTQWTEYVAAAISATGDDA